MPCRELSRLSSELDSQQMRACVLLETLETLQVRGVYGIQWSAALFVQVGRHSSATLL